MENIVINLSLPKDCRDLQIQVEKIIEESGFVANTEKTLKLFVA